MKLIIVRHGETVGNLQAQLQGQSPGYLTDRGIEQAKTWGTLWKV